MEPNVNDLVANAMGGQPEATPESPSLVDAGPEREGYAWAADVYWAYENMGGRMSKEKAGSPGRYALWKYASGNIDDFIKTILPKAMGILEKARDKGGDDAVIEQKETKSIAEMQRLLRRAVAEALGTA